MLTINLPLVAANLVTFLIGMFLLRLIAYKPLAAMFQARIDKIRGDLKAADDARREMESRKKDYDGQIAELGAQAQEQLRQAARENAAMREEIVAAARKQGEELIARAGETIAQEKTRAIKELRREVLDISLQLTEKVVGQAADPELQRRMVDKMFVELEAKKKRER